EFKEEAVRQVVERGYRVPDVAARLGVSAHSLYKWVKAVSPTDPSSNRRNFSKPRARFFACVRSCDGRRRAGSLKKSRAVLCQGTRVKYRFMNEHSPDYAITLMCRL